MNARATLALLLLAPALAGCLSGTLPGGTDASDSSLAGVRISSTNGTVTGTQPLLWQGKSLTFADDREAACEPANCERFTFEANFPDGFWEAHDGALEVSVRWPLVDGWNWRQSGFFAVTLRDAEGRLLAEGDGSSASVILLPDAASGVYEVTVIASVGESFENEGWSPLNPSGTYQGVIQVDAAPVRIGAPRDLLPDLITMVPMSLMIAEPWHSDPAKPVRDAAGMSGCSSWEMVQDGVAQRCLRLTNAVGNAGDGIFEVRLDSAQAYASLAGQGRFTQRIYRDDGSFHDKPAGVASYHATHQHIHYQGMSQFTVYKHDLATGARGDIVGEGRKIGVCSSDIGLIELGRLGTTLPGGQWQGCQQPLPEPGSQYEWSMGMGPGWYDPYSASRDEQYVDIGDAPDGVYELVSVVDPEHTLIESDRTNNEASVVFRLTGDEVEVLSWTGRALW